MDPVLLIMAAGLGSRFGGLKQMAPVDDHGRIIIDYSLEDAFQAGFRQATCIINPAHEADFREHFANRHPGIEIHYAHQLMDNIPPGFAIPNGRTKPWGTAHAVLSAKQYVNGPFAVINADDYYGAMAFEMIFDFLQTKASPTRHAMVGYKIENTLTESGSVARGVCTLDGTKLVRIVETLGIVPTPTGAAYPSDEGQIHIPAGTLVSMNMWGFDHVIMGEIETRFAAFLTQGLQENPQKCEFFLPSVVSALMEEGKAEVEVLPTADKWHGVTYAQDLPKVREALANIRR